MSQDRLIHYGCVYQLTPKSNRAHGHATCPCEAHSRVAVHVNLNVPSKASHIISCLLKPQLYHQPIIQPIQIIQKTYQNMQFT